MQNLRNSALSLTVSDDGREVKLLDVQRGQGWSLDPLSLLCIVKQDGEEKRGLLAPSGVSRPYGNNVEITYGCFGKDVVFRYALLADSVEVTFASGKSDDIQGLTVALPGSFEPEDTGMKKYLIPLCQGMQWDARGRPFETIYPCSGYHSGFTMDMTGCLGSKGGLLCAVETAADVNWLIGKDEHGRSYFTNLQISSLGGVRYDRKIRLYCTGPSVTAVAKRYRMRVIERGRFKPWSEKITERPQVERLFGALLCHIGYCQDDLDYAEECRKLKAMGFGKVFIDNARRNIYNYGLKMGGLPQLSLDRETVLKIRELGYEVAPHSLINIILRGDETKARYNIRADGKPALSWQFDDNKFYNVCTGTLPEYQRNADRESFSDMTWNYFDTTAAGYWDECWATDHESHPGRPLTRAENQENIRSLFLVAQEGGRVVESEGFRDAYSMEYDIGDTLALPQYGPWEFWPVPMTQLVYHDSMAHVWYEGHCYNDFYFGFTVGNQYQYTGGQPRLQSAADALYGEMPHVFGFGATYTWKNAVTKESLSYRFRLEDPLVRYSLDLARPVCDLHRKIGMLEMTDFEFLSEDGYVQKTVFADGTEVYANFRNNNSRCIDALGRDLLPESWEAKRGI